MPHVGRYAPSPSGDLHVGNARTALLAWLWARGEGGGASSSASRISIPTGRAPRSRRRQRSDLAALGLDWDEMPVWQSERGALYERALEELAGGRSRLPLLLLAGRRRAPPRSPRTAPAAPAIRAPAAGSTPPRSLADLPEVHGRASATAAPTAATTTCCGARTASSATSSRSSWTTASKA